MSLVSACSTSSDPFYASDPYKDSVYKSAEDLEREMHPGESGSALALARVARKTRAAGDPRSAINVYRRAHQISPRNVRILVELGETLASVGAFEEAREVLARAVEIESNAGI